MAALRFIAVAFNPTKENAMQLSLSIEEVSASTGLGKTKLYELINTGELKARKIGKRTLVLKSDLEEFLNSLQPYGFEKLS